MFVCCMFLELGLGSVWNLNCHGFLLEPSFFGVLVQVFGILCTPLFFCVPCGCSTCLLCYSWCFFVSCYGWVGNSRSIQSSFEIRRPVFNLKKTVWQNWSVLCRQGHQTQQPRPPGRLCAVEFKQSGTKCVFTCVLMAVFCTKRNVNTFKDLESKSSTYVRYASSVDD